MPARFRLCIVEYRGDIGHQRMRGGKAHAGFQARACGAGIDGMQVAKVHRSPDQCVWLVRVGQTPQDRIQRQLRQQYAGPQHACGSMRRQRKRARGKLPAATFAYVPMSACMLHAKRGRGCIGNMFTVAESKAQAIATVGRHLQPP